MKMSIVRIALLVALVSLLVSACAQPATPTQPAQEEKPFRVAVVMPSTITDLAFSQSFFEALKKVQEEEGGPSKI